jgi:hypothetical protein
MMPLAAAMQVARVTTEQSRAIARIRPRRRESVEGMIREVMGSR